MPYPIESSFAEKLSLGDSKTRKMNRSKKPKSKLDKRSDLKRPGTSRKPNAKFPYSEKERTCSRDSSVLENVRRLVSDDDDDDDDDDEEEEEPRPTIGSITPRELDEAWERGEDPMDDLLYREVEKFSKDGPKYATAAVSYMRGKGHNLEVVKPGLFQGASDEDVELIHFNFKARSADDPNAPVETYFVQLNDYWSGDIIVDCCVSVGKSAPPLHKRDMQGCELCFGKLVHHPVAVGSSEGIRWGHLKRVRAPWLKPV